MEISSLRKPLKKTNEIRKPPRTTSNKSREEEFSVENCQLCQTPWVGHLIKGRKRVHWRLAEQRPLGNVREMTFLALWRLEDGGGSSSTEQGEGNGEGEWRLSFTQKTETSFMHFHFNKTSHLKYFLCAISKGLPYILF